METILLFSYFGQILATSESSPLPSGTLFCSSETYFLFCQSEPWELIFPVKRSLGLASLLAPFSPFLPSLPTACPSLNLLWPALPSCRHMLGLAWCLPLSLSHFSLSVWAPPLHIKQRLPLPILKGQTPKPWLSCPCHRGSHSLFPSHYLLSSLPHPI